LSMLLNGMAYRVSKRERQRGRERDSEEERETARKRVRGSCVHVYRYIVYT